MSSRVLTDFFISIALEEFPEMEEETLVQFTENVAEDVYQYLLFYINQLGFSKVKDIDVKRHSISRILRLKIADLPLESSYAVAEDIMEDLFL